MEPYFPEIDNLFRQIGVYLQKQQSEVYGTMMNLGILRGQGWAVTI